jgi:enoyl-CoA hydratase/carnithine racemase
MRMTRKNGILEVRLHTDDGPLKFSWKAHSMWSQAWIDIGRDPENEVMILTGTGDRWLDANPEVWKKLFREWTQDDKLKMYHESLRLLENLIFCVDIPTIAAINGPGTHCEIGTLCDITLCTEDTDFFDPHFLGGTPPGDGMALTLQRTIGIKRAAYYAYTGRKLDGKTALELGIVNEVLPREQLLPRAWELAEMMMERSRGARMLTHSILSRPWKQALVQDQGFHLTHQMYDMANDEEGPLARLMKLRARFQKMT